jgi:catechol 2,3-dioxygenase-like lactoylglutathione lyase family enzyme
VGVNSVTAQVRTTNLAESLDFYVSRLGFELDFRYEDFYAGVKIAEGQRIHFKLVDDTDPSIDYVREGSHLHLYIQVDDIESYADWLQSRDVVFSSGIDTTPWGTKEFYIADNQGHTLCFAQIQDS